MESNAETQPEDLKTKDIISYRKKYYQEHKEDYNKKEVCSICGHTYKIYNKSHHKRLKKHKIAVERMEKEKLQKELDELKNKIKDLL